MHEKIDIKQSSYSNISVFGEIIQTIGAISDGNITSIEPQEHQLVKYKMKVQIHQINLTQMSLTI